MNKEQQDKSNGDVLIGIIIGFIIGVVVAYLTNNY